MNLKIRALDKLLNYEVFKWQLLSQFKKNQKENKIKYNPCITFSREPGSGGKLIAKLVAKKLKLKYYDKKIVEMIVKQTRKRKELIQSIDERKISLLEDLLSTFFNKRKISSSTYFRNLVKVILALAQKQSCVISGRGANFILPATYNLRVRVIAPFMVRVRNNMLYEKQSIAEAKRSIREIHYHRKEFIKKFFYKNISNANYYDLVINTEYISIKQAVKLVVVAFKNRFL